MRYGLLTLYCFLLLSCGSREKGRADKMEYKLGPGTEQVVLDRRYDLHWVWEDEFNPTEQEMLKKWLNRTFHATQQVLGPYPFDVTFHLYRSDPASEPVPWAHTLRSEGQTVHFYVDTSYDYDLFVDDWTAPHEISHLALPFLGKKYSWFAEGFATFMQCQVMLQMETMTVAEVAQKYKQKIEEVKTNYNSTLPFVEVAQDLRSRHNYSAMYWGSVNFFIQLDEALKELNGSGLNELIRSYQACCRNKDETMEDLISSLDSLIGKEICMQLMQKYTSGPAKDCFD